MLKQSLNIPLLNVPQLVLKTLEFDFLTTAFKTLIEAPPTFYHWTTFSFSFLVSAFILKNEKNIILRIVVPGS